MSQPGNKPEIHRGLEGVVVDESTICYVDGINLNLYYRGYVIDELVGKASYEEVAYLLLKGRLPTAAELSDWTEQLEENRAVEPEIVSWIVTLPQEADPMAMLMSAICMVGMYDPKANETDAGSLHKKAMRVIAKTPAIVAAIGRINMGEKPISPKGGLSHAADFLYMLHGKEPSNDHVEALDAYFVLLAEHGFNASTFAARSVTATQSDFFSSIAAAIGSLKGPLHGAANRKAMEMLLEIEEPSNIDTYVKKTIESKQRFMGFGHRVYKGADPRGKHLKQYTEILSKKSSSPKWFEIAEKLRGKVEEAKGLSINVDYYSAPLLHYLGIPTDLFTTMFASSRMAGWSAHIIEQTENNRLIRPKAHYVGPHDLKFVPIDQRKA